MLIFSNLGWYYQWQKYCSICFKPPQLENKERYDKKAFYKVDR